MVKKISTYYLQIFDDILFKIIYVFLIVYYACFDPMYSIALTTLMIISIQELHSRNATHSITSLLPKNTMYNTTISNIGSNQIGSNQIGSNQIGTINSSNNILNLNLDKLTTNIFDNDELVYELINKHSLQKKPSSDDKLTAEYELCNNPGPAYKTITDNISESSNSIELLNKTLNKPINESLMEIQNSQELNVNENENQEIYEDILNIKSLPNGFDPKNKYISL